MKNIFKTASEENFSIFLHKLDAIDKPLPEFNISKDLKELNNEIEKKTITPPDKETMNFVIKFIKTNGAQDNLHAILFNLDHNGDSYEIKLITRDPENPRISIYGKEKCVTDIEGKVIIPSQTQTGINLHKTKTGITVENHRDKQQKFVNEIFQNLANYY